ncbi:MAG: FAD-dependent oxidoreductase [Candidatus Wallbacteria bacterium]|nr:FAD-dependent oxidoreductase [Candidatus Wallbacteria bacterium]
MPRKVIIIGGVAGGASCAARLRRNDESAEISIIERGEHISFANCGLPYHLSGAIPDYQDLLIHTPESFRSRFNVTVRVRHEALEIHREKKTVLIRDLKLDRTSEEPYDQLVLSPGASSLKIPFEGNQLPAVYNLRNIPDLQSIMKAISCGAKRALIVGCGYIGLEVAENLVRAGLSVFMVETASQVLSNLDPEMAVIVRNLMSGKIKLCLSDRIRKAEQNGSGLLLTLESGRQIGVDLVIVGAGVVPESMLAASCGLKLGIRNSIVVDAFLRTSDPDIYAVGDAVEIENAVDGTRVCLPLAGPANRQGRIAADNICGAERKYSGTLGTAITRFFELTVASCGLNEKCLKNSGIDFTKVYTHALSHAGYYPGAGSLSLKLLFCRADGKLLGAQILGTDGVDKRMDVLAAMIKFKKTVFDLTELELSYAPPYSSAKDPVNLAGYAAENMLRGIVRVAYPEEIDLHISDGGIVLDVRSQEEISAGAIPGSIHIPLPELRSKMAQLPSGKPIIINCQTGLRSYIACRILSQHGLDVRNLSGGYKTYKFYKQSSEP